MSFLSVLKTGQLPEKPWPLGAVLRLVVSVLVCALIGAVVAADIGYFTASPQKSAGLFIAGSVGAFLCFAGALFVLRRPWPLEKHLRNLTLLLTCIYGGFFTMWFIGKQAGDHADLQNSTLRILISAITFQGSALVLAHFFLREQLSHWAEGFGLNLHPKHALLLGVVVGVVILPLVLGLQGLSISLLQSVSLQPHEQEMVQLLRTTETWSSRFLLGLTTIFIAPAGEEILFRGILYPAIKHAGYPRTALWSTSILFGLIHGNLPAFLPLIVMALVLVWLYEYTGNLLACFTVHSLFNAVNFVALYLFQK
jgi:membrane protease YdiL (CAAX protease family)